MDKNLILFEAKQIQMQLNKLVREAEHDREQGVKESSDRIAEASKSLCRAVFGK